MDYKIVISVKGTDHGAQVNIDTDPPAIFGDEQLAILLRVSAWVERQLTIAGLVAALSNIQKERQINDLLRGDIRS